MNSLAPYSKKYFSTIGIIATASLMTLTSDVLRNKVGVSTSINSMHEKGRGSNHGNALNKIKMLPCM